MCIRDRYYAVLCGYPDASEGELVDYLRKEGSVAVAVTGREKNFPDAKIAKLHYSILEKINQPMPLALADVCIGTGRFHQIRVQFAHAGWPLLGDTKYGNTTVAGTCLLYTSDAADEEDSVDLGGRRIIKKKKTNINTTI